MSWQLGVAFPRLIDLHMPWALTICSSPPFHRAQEEILLSKRQNSGKTV